MRNPALVAIKLYQLAVSPYLPGLCRHTPSCSNYSYEAISRHGFSSRFVADDKTARTLQPVRKQWI